MYKRQLENGLAFISLGDERKRLEKEQYVHEQHLAENKRQNLVKKACLFIVKMCIRDSASTTHSQLNAEELAEQGIYPGTVRLSIGTEHIDCLLYTSRCV